MSVPKQIAAGATLLFTETLSSYPATLWTLDFVLNLEGVLVAKIRATDSSTNFIVTAPIATTAKWKPGRYGFALIVTEVADATNVIQACAGQTSVTPNLAANLAPTAAQQQLVAIDAAILKLCKSANAEVNFNGQMRRHKDLPAMIDARNAIQARVDAELRRLGLSTRGGARRIVTRFTP